jgi:hypothetical protein
MLAYIIDTPLHSVEIYSPYNVDWRKYWNDIIYIDIVPTVSSKSCMEVVDMVQVTETDIVFSVVPDLCKYGTFFKVIHTTQTSPMSTNGWFDMSDVIRAINAGYTPRIAVVYTKTTPRNVCEAVYNATYKALGDTFSQIKQINMISMDDFTDIDIYDIIFIFETKNTIRTFVETHRGVVAFLDMENTSDINVLKIAREFYRYENIDVFSEFNETKENLPMKKMVVVDCCIRMRDDIPSRFPRQQLYQLLQNFGEECVAKNNYYTMFFKYNDITVSYLRSQNKKYASRSAPFEAQYKIIPVLEQYEELAPKAPQRFVVPVSVNGILRDKMFIIRDVALHEEFKDFSKGTIFVLSHQAHEFENGEYVLKEKDPLVILQKRTTSSQKQQKESEFDPRYSCYGDSYITNKGLCNSVLDEVGEVKKKQTVWDRPCERNEECPFFQKNTTYDNYRGGCIDGYCELPVGIKRTSWRTYDISSSPICHGCNEWEKNTSCCESQANPDYVFELDFHDRLKRK